MRNFWDRTGGRWTQGKLAGKVTSVFTSTGTRDGQETTITSTWITLAHHGMVIVPIGYIHPEVTNVGIGGGTPYGASVVAGADGSRQADDSELAIAEFQGKHVAEITKKNLWLSVGIVLLVRRVKRCFTLFCRDNHDLAWLKIADFTPLRV